MEGIRKYKALLSTALILGGGIAMGANPGLIALILCILLAFVYDFETQQAENNRTALAWILSNVELVHEPVEDSDAPEEVRNLVDREGGDY